MKTFRTLFFAAAAALCLFDASSCQQASGSLKSSDKQLTSFTFTAATNSALSADAAGTVDQTARTVSVTLPFGTSLASLTATFGASANASVSVNGVSQTSGVTANNFSGTVPYTVTAEDGSTQTYVVAAAAAGSAATYTVHFDANGGTGTMADEPFAFGKSKSLTANAFTQAGSFFCGWSPAAGGAAVYADGQKVLNVCYSDAGDAVTLYAVWFAEDSAPCALPAGTGGSAGTTGSYVLFGMWPQTIAANGVTVSATETETRGAATYYKGSDSYWYAKVTAAPYNDATDYTFTDGTAVTKGTAYYFKVEPIKWRVLETGKLLAESILANVCYYGSSFSRTLGSTTIYANNYKYSNIRAWLNSTKNQFVTDGGTGGTYDVNWSSKGFLQQAFTTAAQAYIAVTAVDNSAASTTDDVTNGYNGGGTNQYACDDTSDRIYLLSELEATNNATDKFGAYTAYDTLRRRTVSDYARATGAFMNTTAGDYQFRGWWRLRSPDYGNNDYACHVYYDGSAHGQDGVWATYGGVVPALSITQ